MFKAAFIALLVCLLLAGSAYAAEIHTRDGKTYRGEIRFMDGGTIVILHDGQSTSLKNSDIGEILMDDPGKPGTHGLLGTYFNNRQLHDPRAKRIDPQIDFTWPQGQPVVDRLDGQQYSIRWVGQIEPQFSEQYTFSINQTGGGARLFINNQKVIETGNDGHGAARGQIVLQAGQRYDIRVEYQNFGQDGLMQLFWASARQTEQIVPGKCLYPSDADAEDGTGLMAQYSSNGNHKHVQTDPMINFTWGGNIVAGISANSPFSIRWIGYIKPPSAGNYTFYTHCGGGVRLMLNNIAVIDDLKAQAPMDHTGTVNFDSTKKVLIMMDYAHTTGPAMAQLRWLTGNQHAQDVPMACLFADIGRHDGPVPQLPASAPMGPPTPGSGVVLSDGSMIAATPGEIDPHGNATLHWQQKDLTVPAQRIAMVFEDRNVAQDDWTWPAERGALLRNGDFVEGGIVSFKNGQVRVSSIIFGLKDYNLGDLRAVLLQKPTAATGGFFVRCNNGSAYTASALTFKSNAVVVDTDVLGQITINAGDIYSIKSLK